MAPFDQVRPFLEPVIGLRGDRIPTLAPDQQVVLPEQPKEAVPAQALHAGAHLPAQDAAQLQGSHPVGVLPYLAYPAQYQVAANLRLLLVAQVLVIGLSCFAK